MSLDILKIDSWDGERAKVDVNGVTCWTSKRLYGNQGTQVCGNSWYEDRLTAKCSAKARSGAMKVTIHSTLNQNSNNEAFAIDNVKLSGSGGGSGDLDYETSLLKKFEMQVSAKDSGNLRATAKLTVNLIDKNEEPILSIQERSSHSQAMPGVK